MGISTTQRIEVSAVPPSTPTSEASPAGRMPPAPSTPAAVEEAPRPSGGGVIERNILGLLSSQVATWLITLVSLVVVPRRLGAQDVGRLGFATAFVAFFTLIGLLGTNTFIVKTVARDRSKVGPYVLNAIVLKLYLCGLLSAVAIALAYVLGPVFDYGQDTKVLVAIMCIGMTFAVLNDALLAGLQGLERMARAAAWAAIGHYVGTGLGLYVVLTSRSLFAYAFALTLIGFVPAIANAYAMWPHLRHAGPVSFDLWKQIARGGLPFLVWASFLLIYGTIDIPLLQALSNEETVGWYTTAYRWVSTPVFIASVVLTAFLPSLSTDAHNNPAKFAARTNGALRVVFMVTAPLAVGAALVAGDAISLAYEADFARAVPVLQILAIHIPFAAMSMVLGMALIASDRQKRWVVVGGLAALTNPLFNLVAIPYAVRTYENGAIGAAVITVVTELLMIAGALYLRPPGVLDRATAKFVLRCAVASGLMVPAVFIASSLPRLESHAGSGTTRSLVGLTAEIAVGVVVYAVASIALRTVSIDEVRGYAPRVLAALPLRRTKQSTNSE